jgi:hypothetical protein
MLMAQTSTTKIRVRVLSGVIALLALAAILGAQHVTAAPSSFEAANSKGTTESPLLTYHNGPVLHSPGVTAIFWGSQWNDPAFAGDIVTGLTTFFSGYSGSLYAHALTEYYDTTGYVTDAIKFPGFVVMDPSITPSGLARASDLIAEACRITGNAPDPTGLYVVFSPNEAGPNGRCGGMHTFGSCGNGRKRVPIQVISVPYTTGTVDSGCGDTADTETGHSLALAQMANVTAHELVETITDPLDSGWYGADVRDEVGDKCVTIYPPMASYPLFSDGTTWKLQGIWSNAAYSAGSGAPNLNSQPGCIW